MERNLTTGNVGKNILIFSLPYLLSYFLQTLYGMADLFIIHRLAGDAHADRYAHRACDGDNRQHCARSGRQKP